MAPSLSPIAIKLRMDHQHMDEAGVVMHEGKEHAISLQPLTTSTKW